MLLWFLPGISLICGSRHAAIPGSPSPEMAGGCGSGHVHVATRQMDYRCLRDGGSEAGPAFIWMGRIVRLTNRTLGLQCQKNLALSELSRFHLRRGLFCFVDQLATQVHV